MSYRVFEYLKRKNKLQYYVFVSATSVWNNFTYPSNVLDWESNSTLYHSYYGNNQSVRIDFPIERVFVERFFIKSAVNRDPYNWDLEGSIDAVNFTTLYSNNEKMCEWDSFDIENTIGCTENVINEYTVYAPDYYKSIRIKSTGLSSNDDTILAFSGLELYGHIQLIVNSCFKHFYWSLFHLLLNFVIII